MPPRRIYLFSMMLCAISNLGFAVVAEGFWTAMAFRVLAGIGLAGTYMPGLKLLSDHLEDLGHGRPLAFYTASFGLGAALSFLLAGEAAAALGWQWAFGIAAAGPVAAVILILIGLPREDPVSGQQPGTHLLDFRPVLRCRPAMGYVMAYTIHNFELFALRSWMVAFLVFSQGLQPALESGGGPGWSPTVLASLIVLAAVPASVIGNELAGRFGRHRVITVIMIVSAGFAAFLGFTAALPFWLVVVLCLIYAVAIAGDSASITAGVVAAAPPGYRGATMAVHSCIGFAGSFAGPLLFGVVLDLAGGGTIASWGWAFAFVALVALTGPVFLALSRK